MQEADLKYFILLKEKVTQTFRKSYTVSSHINEWKGQDITNFQDELAEKVKGRISEKWFYTHFKSDSSKLPRIDMLNLLSEYVGYQNWSDFKTKETTTILSKTTKSKNQKATPWIIALMLFIVVFVSYILLPSSTTKKYQFCFIDADRGTPITYPIEIIVLKDSESPIRKKCDSNSCFSIKYEEAHLSFVVKSPYYKTDTITRIINGSGSERVKLKTNDYALMIHIFSKSKIKDWKKRRRQLDKMIANNALIYQIDQVENIGIELYNKKEFIDKLTMPINSLKNIEILETIYQGNQIIKMRFRQQLLK